MITFGPVPSRRLGKSLGINNIPSRKLCSYSCVYCQVGITKYYTINRETFFTPDVIFSEVKNHLSLLSENDKPDYLTIVANGEPTLDLNLGKTILRLKDFKIPIAVITNASLLFDVQVREDLNYADLVSVKVDAPDEAVWKKMNRPAKGLTFSKYLSGLQAFKDMFNGLLISETMLVAGVNDDAGCVAQTADLVAALSPSVAYLSIPTRPPADSSVKSPDESSINRAWNIFSDKRINTELITGFEGTFVGVTGNVIEDIANMCSVHPIRDDVMCEILIKDKADETILSEMISSGYIAKVEHDGHFYYLRKFKV
ncbi:MAG: radical SAM protein [Bacteroidetes bacterium GWF2_43_63]|nr:MAG: radical SAM protein [Bacteroidetes bacterium GWE2_42_42]OFY55994.1 MAG: radical SAM protein [Bacteroidetes bacterium GWF2_43_63]HBG70767.1 radical SAM protein [Bacteroidales bacterium]HCB62405.1 radical SAM protein [Bacteroidales bacterium]HCY21860.1 radical SAM protein [Bacteroidales bacterium]